MRLPFLKKKSKSTDPQTTAPFSIPQQTKNAPESTSKTAITLSDVQNTYSRQGDNKTARLMELIGSAIEEWQTEFHLESLPKGIVFQQALDAMQAMEPLFVAASKKSKK